MPAESFNTRITILHILTSIFQVLKHLLKRLLDPILFSPSFSLSLFFIYLSPISVCVPIYITTYPRSKLSKHGSYKLQLTVRGIGRYKKRSKIQAFIPNWDKNRPNALYPTLAAIPIRKHLASGVNLEMPRWLQ